MAVVDTRRDDRLVGLATIFAIAVLVHNFDHLRRGGSAVSTDVFWIGTLAIVDEVAVVVLVYVRHPWAAFASLVSGVSLAAGYVFVHFTPRRTWLSDSLVGGHASALSVFAASLETFAALALAAGAFLILRRPRIESATPQLPPAATTRTWTHPVVLAMVLGNAIVLAGSLLTR
ncbi:MAG: hypothetical protein QOK28_2692 [Actinomycetota bacterium]|jgi:hypothetical protein